MTGAFGTQILRLTNTAATGRALLGLSQGVDIGALRGDNVKHDGDRRGRRERHCPGGRDFLAFGSGRIAMNSHAFSTVSNAYTTGEIHRTFGTLHAMVGATTRRSIVCPSTAGALHPINPFPAYDSRLPAPAPGPLVGGSDRLVSVAEARDPSTGAVTTANAVPAGATGGRLQPHRDGDDRGGVAASAHIVVDVLGYYRLRRRQRARTRGASGPSAVVGRELSS